MGTNNLKHELEQKSISIETVAKILGIHRNSAANKINGRTPFTIEEGFILKRELFPEFEMMYLFASETKPQRSA